jgi:hypothetical protein
VAVPSVLKYLDAELAAMGIRLKYNVSRVGEPVVVKGKKGWQRRM